MSAHQKICATEIYTLAKKSIDPFFHWKAAVALDRAIQLQESESEFRNAAQYFFDLGSNLHAVEKAMFEYSTLMDAFSNSALGRRFLANEQFEEAANSLTRAGEIFRSTLHFAFLAPYVSACATLATAIQMPSGEQDTLQAYKNAIALLEQAKFTLSFRDETHPVITVIDAYLKFSISGALLTEAAASLASGSKEDAVDKESRSAQLRHEYEHFAKRARLPLDTIEFFPLRDFARREHSAFVVTFPETDKLWLLNIGENPAMIQMIGNVETNMQIEVQSSTSFDLKNLAKGKIRMEYFDPVKNQKYNEGCLTLI